MSNGTNETQSTLALVGQLLTSLGCLVMLLFALAVMGFILWFILTV